MKEDKKIEILMGFFKPQEPLTLKEVVKLASKKGIPENTVKPIMIQLVDNKNLQMEKIGTSSYYFLPSLDLAQKRNELTDAIANMKQEIAQISGELEEFAASNPSISALKAEIQSHLTLSEQLKAKKLELEAPRRNLLNAQKLKKLQKAKELYEENIMALAGYLRTEFNMEREALIQGFQIPESLI